MGVLGGAIWLVVSAAAVMIVAVRLAQRLLPAGDGLEQMLAAGVMCWAQIALASVLLGMVHALYALPVVAVHVVVAVAVLRLVHVPSRPRRTWRPDRTALVAAASAVVVVGVIVALSPGAPSNEFDTNRYHIVNAAQWLTSHEVWTLPYAAPGDHTAAEPGNGELVGTWLMLPSGDDRIAYMGNAGFAVLALLATALLTRRAGGRAAHGMLAGMVVLLSPLVALSQVHSMMTDLPVTVGVLAGAVFLIGAQRRPQPTGAIVVGGAALGLAAGSKLAALPAVATVLVAALVLCAAGSRLRLGLLSIVAAVTTGGFWYLRNAVATGNPVYPLDVTIGGHRLLAGSRSPLSVSTVSLLTSVRRHGLSLVGLWWSALLTQLYAIAVLLTFVVLGAVLLWRAGGRPRRLPWGAWAILATACLGLIGYALAPNSGGGDDPTKFLLTAGLRYLMPWPFMLIAVVATMGSGRFLEAGLLSGITADLTVVIPGDPSYRPDLHPTLRAGAAAVVAALVLGAVVFVAARVPRPSVGALAAAALGGAGGAAWLLASAGHPSSGGPVAAALARATADRPVVVVNVSDVRALLGDQLDVPLRSVGVGTVEGARAEVGDAAEFTRMLAAARPSLVAVGTDSSAVPPPPGWSPPPQWSVVGRLGETTLYAVAGGA